MIKQLIINGKKSYDDFGVYIGSRNISSPKKKIIKESVPFSNTVYDFSKLNGELYWEERTLEYSFDIAEISTEDMENVKSKLLNWLLNVHDTDIYDPYIGDYHFHGSYDSDSWEEDFGAGTISVTFTVYPFKISNSDSSEIEEIGTDTDGTLENSIEGATKKLTVYGRSTQETRTGKNLYNIVDELDKHDTYVVTHNDDFQTLSYDNSSGTVTGYISNMINKSDELKVDSKYYIVVEIKSVTGTGFVRFVSNHENNKAGQFITEVNAHFTDLKAGQVIIREITTRSDFTNCESMLRGIGEFSAGQSGSITYRISVLENSVTSDTFVYEKYGASPSPDYPSDIKSVGYQNFFDHEYFFANYVMHSTSNSAVGRCVYQLEPNTRYMITTNLGNTTSAFVFAVSGNNTDFSPSTNNNGARINYGRIVTTDDDGYLTIGIYVTDTNAVTLEDFTSGTAEVQIAECEDSNKHQHIPFSKYGIEVKSNTKNLFDYLTNFNTSINGLTNTINDDGSITVSGVPTTNWVSIVPAQCIDYLLEDGERYMMWSKSNDKTRVFLEVYAIDKITGAYTYYSTYNSSGTTSFKVNLSKYIYNMWLISNNTTVWGTESKTITGFYQLEKGDTVTSFEKYKSDTKLIVLDEPLRSVSDTIKDSVVIENNTLKVTRYTSELILNGSERWDIGEEAFFAGNTLMKPKSLFVSSHFKNVTTYVDMIAANYGIGNLYSAFSRIYLKNPDLASVDDLKTWLSENNVHVVYELAEPIVETIEFGEAIPTYEGTTQIFLSDETTLEVEYDELITKTIINNSSHRIVPTITSTGNFTIKLNDISYSIGVGTSKNKEFFFEMGENILEIVGSGKITFTYVEECF